MHICHCTHYNHHRAEAEGVIERLPTVQYRLAFSISGRQGWASSGRGCTATAAPFLLQPAAIIAQPVGCTRERWETMSCQLMCLCMSFHAASNRQQLRTRPFPFQVRTAVPSCSLQAPVVGKMSGAACRILSHDVRRECAADSSTHCSLAWRTPTVRALISKPMRLLLSMTAWSSAVRRMSL